jgi:hypothetical protein
LSPSSQPQITVIDVVIRPPSWKSTNIFNKPCTTHLICTNIVYNSIPHHERENLKFLVGHQVLPFPFYTNKTTSSKCIPLYCRSPHLLASGEIVEKRRSKFIFLIPYPVFVPLCPLSLCYFAFMLVYCWTVDRLLMLYIL